MRCRSTEIPLGPSRRQKSGEVRSQSRSTSPCRRSRAPLDGHMHVHMQQEREWVLPAGPGSAFSEGDGLLVPPPLPMRAPNTVKAAVSRPAAALGKPVPQPLPSVSSPQAVASIPSPIPTPVLVQSYPPSRSVSPQTRHRMPLAGAPRPQIPCWKSPAALSMDGSYQQPAMQVWSNQRPPSAEPRGGRERTERGDSIYLRASDLRSCLPSPEPMARMSPPRRGGRFVDMASQELSPEGISRLG